ncbi:MAG: hypothetical protein ACPLQO_08150 [Desulfotomaculales bacterium]
MDPIKQLQIETAARELVCCLRTLHDAAGAFGINGDIAPDGMMNVAVQVRERDFEALAAGRATATQRLEHVKDYPWKKSVVICGVRFFTLLKEFKEAI